MTIVAARPAMGKSSLLLATADACSAAGFGAHLFSLEDTEEAYADRTLARTSDVPAEDLRNARLDRGGYDRIVRVQMPLRGRRWICAPVSSSQMCTDFPVTSIAATKCDEIAIP